ncbi:MAG TPA: tetratricopeptide repeat protein [Terriglobales bacterium]|nr:tetratricopeptide repeat protein [Terriglobales bacterium]
MSATSIPALERMAEPKSSRFQAWFQWFMQPAVLIRIVLYATTLIYLRSVLFDYVYDDSALITLNPWMESWKQVPELFTHSFWGFLDVPRAIDFYRPLVSLVFMTILHLLGPAPGWFHLVAAGLHIAATYLVYRLACETTENKIVAAIAAGFFGLHPTKVETAAWISGISDSLSVVFFLGSIISYFKARKNVEHRLKYQWTSNVLLLLALFSKEAAVFAPVLIAIYEFSSTNSRFRDRCVASLRAALPFLTVTTLALLARKALIHNELDLGLLQKIPLKATVLTAPKAILWYLLKQLWPGELSVQYPIMLVRTFSFRQFVLPLVLTLAVTTAIVWAVRKRPTGIFFASWFVLMLAPVIVYFITLQEHDRYSYLPSVASSIGIAYLLERLRVFSAKVHAAVILIVFAVMSVLTVTYESYWDNDIKLFERAVRIAPDNWNAQNYLAGAYVVFGQREKAEAFARSVINRDRGPNSWYLLGDVFLAECKYEEAREAIQTGYNLEREHHLVANLALANVDLRLGRNEEAVQIYQEQLKRFPNRAFLHGHLATALKAMGRSEEAQRELAIQKSLNKH